VRSINELVDRNIRLSPASEQVLGKHPRVYLVTGIFQVLAGGLFALIGQGMDGVFRMGVLGIGALVIAFGVWQVAYAWALRSATGRLR